MGNYYSKALSIFLKNNLFSLDVLSIKKYIFDCRIIESAYIHMQTILSITPSKQDKYPPLFAFAVTFSDFFSRRCSLPKFQHRGLFQLLCVWVSHVARRYRFASCKLLNSARCIRASESGIRARSSLSSLCALSSHEVPENSRRLNVARI